MINYLQGVICGHKLKGYPSPSVSSDEVRLAVMGLKNDDILPVPRDPMTLTHLKLMFPCLNVKYNSQLMFWAAILLLFPSLLRVSHATVSPHCLCICDVDWVGSGLVLKVYSSKSMKRSTTARFIPIAPLENNKFCAIYWLRLYLSKCK